jgi:hypothetical protein
MEILLKVYISHLLIVSKSTACHYRKAGVQLGMRGSRAAESKGVTK